MFDTQFLRTQLREHVTLRFLAEAHWWSVNKTTGAETKTP